MPPSTGDSGQGRRIVSGTPNPLPHGTTGRAERLPGCAARVTVQIKSRSKLIGQSLLALAPLSEIILALAVAHLVPRVGDDAENLIARVARARPVDHIVVAYTP